MPEVDHISFVPCLEKMQPIPALHPENPEGIRCRSTVGAFRIPYDISQDAVWTPNQVKSLREIPKIYPQDYNMQKPQFFAAEAEGYFKVSSTDTWYFSTLYDELWIDGRLVVDNRGEVKKNYRHDGTLVLEEGIHHYRLVFMSNVTGGWITARNKGEVLTRKAGSNDWKSLKTL